MKKNIIYSFVCLISLCLSQFQLVAEIQPVNIVVIGDDGFPIDTNNLDFKRAQNSEVEDLWHFYRERHVEPVSWYEWFWKNITIDEEVYNPIEKIAHENFGGLLRIAGYYCHPSEIGIVGNGEINDKVRITLVNGVLNIQEDIKQSANLFSSTHGGTNIHYIFRPTQGLHWDILKSIFVRCGYISQQAYDIAAAWRLLIDEMGGVGNGGKIIHYAHSIGAADTFAAKNLLEPEEIAMIAVVTFGSPIVFPNVGFQSVVNYVSVRDSIPFLKMLRIFLEEEDEFIYVGTHVGFPLVDHLLEGGAYGCVIEILGQEFIDTYANN
ncbi:MAG: hypothetical protein H0U49_10935 [Parachlamydiaceae bacterium]|nr:hypothetical protein [Parachlamydiaceae bacterium]